MTRLHYLIILMAILLIAAYSNWLITTFKPTSLGGKPQISRHEPNYFIEDADSTVFDAGGIPHYRLIAKQIKHYPDDNSVDLVEPHIQVYQQRTSLPPWEINADHGKVLQRGKLIQFDGNVIIHRSATRQQNETQLLTQKLLVQPQDSYAESPLKVEILHGANRLSGIGMEVRFDEGRLDILSEGRGMYVVQP